jgi:colicin import membrane protein
MNTDFTKAPEVIEASKLAEGVVALAKDYKVTTVAQYEAGGEQLMQVKGAQKRLEDLRTSITKPLNETLKAVNALFKAPGERLESAEKTIKAELIRFTNEQERLRIVEQRRLDDIAAAERRRVEAAAAEARRVAEEKAAAERAEAQRQRDVAAEAERAAAIARAQGDIEAAAAAEAQRAEAARLAARAEVKADNTEAKAADKAMALEEQASSVVAPVLQRDPPKVAGINGRMVPQFEITDASLLPREYLVPDEKKIRGVVNALKQDAKIPGVTVRMVRQIAAGAA